MLRSLLVASFIAASAIAAPALRAVQKFSGPTVPNSYIVTLKSGSSKSSFLKSHPELASTVTHRDWDAALLNGFAGVFDTAALDVLRSSVDVASITEDGLVFSQTIQTDAPWGLGRLSSAGALTGSASALNYSFAYEAAYQGQGVDIYVVDTGIYTAHNEFGGRATNGWTAPGLGLTDDQGHGTYCAGVAGGVRYGVAKRATLIGVKVFSASGSGTLSDVVSGFNYVLQTSKSTGRPSVALFAGGGAASTAIDNAVVSLTSAGVHVVVAAGGSNTSVENTSPARVPSAITVGATTIGDARASFSNYGPGIDIFAPGVSITGPTIGGVNATIVLSGTSPAAAYVAGLVALYISQVGNNPPAGISASLWSTYGVLSGIPSGTVNRLTKGPITL